MDDDVSVIYDKGIDDWGSIEVKSSCGWSYKVNSSEDCM